MDNWQEVTLGELSINGKGNYGIGASAVPYDNKLYTYIRITDITDDGNLNKKKLMSVNDKNAKKYILKSNDIVFARTGGSTGRSYFYDGSMGELIYAGFLVKFSINDKLVNPKFLKYYTKTKEYKNWIYSVNTGSTRGNINAKMYAEMKINLPPRNQQNFLIDILSCLDDKIELNNRINENLEEMAQAIFKQWFVDFEFPNEDGKPYKSSGGAMVDSELGEIPTGWEVKSLKNISEITSGYSYKSIELKKSNSALITIKNFDRNRGFKKNGFKEIECLKIPKKNQFVQKYEIIVAHTDLTQNADIIGNAEIILGDYKYENLIISMDLVKISSNSNKIDNFILLYYLKNKKFKSFCLKFTNGTTVLHLSKKALPSYKIILPTKKILSNNKSIFEKILRKINNNNNENQKLEQIRDTLLPKLMSGQVRVNTNK